MAPSRKTVVKVASKRKAVRRARNVVSVAVPAPAPATAKQQGAIKSQRAMAKVPVQWRRFFADDRAEKKLIMPGTDVRREVLADAELPAFRPAWVKRSPAPREIKLAPPPTVMLGKKKVKPMFVYPPDGRRMYNDLSYPWGCICRITAPNGKVGSGVLVGPRHVLTASHCVDWTSRTPERVEVHYVGNRAAADANSIAAYPVTEIGDTLTNMQVDEDIAVLVLDQRLGDAFGWFGAKTYSSSWDGKMFWWNIGYPLDVGNAGQPTYQKNRKLDENAWDYGSARAMRTNADIWECQSGGPMFGFWDGMPYAVAVVSSGSADGKNYCAGGTALVDLIKKARKFYP